MEFGDTFESKINRSDYKILIVDDVVSNVLLLKILLTNEKFKFVPPQTVILALSRQRRNIQT